jgi:hypothetical protein
MIIEQVEYTRYSFSGHDSFQCRMLWLKKGYDYLKSGRKFSDDDGVIKLGVGKNMVSSIHYWLKAFDIIDSDDNPTAIGEFLFDDVTGRDPYLEDEASLWLLHHNLVKSGHASMYSIIFNELRKEKLFFSKETVVNYIKRIAENNPLFNFNEKTVAKDFIVFTNLYKNDNEGKDIEESYSGILSELEILKSDGKGKSEQYFIENNDRDSLPCEIFLFAILDNSNFGNSISLNALEFNFNSPGSIFALNRSGILQKISEIVSKYNGIVYNDHAGIKELQFKEKPSVYSILEQYYAK